MWEWVGFAIGLFVGTSTGILLFAMLEQMSPPESDSHSGNEDRKEYLRAEYFAQGTLSTLPDSHQTIDTEDRGWLH